MENRRKFLKRVSAIGGTALLSSVPVKAAFETYYQDNSQFTQGEYLVLEIPVDADYVNPLETVKIKTEIGEFIAVFDGAGNVYNSIDVSNDMQITVAGALGNHIVVLFDKKGRILDAVIFRVDTKTGIDDAGSQFNSMLKMLFYSIRKENIGCHRMNEQSYMTYAGWFRDHVHILKSMKYFDPETTSGLDLWALGQKQNGMLADNCFLPENRYKSWQTQLGDEYVWKEGKDSDCSTFYVRMPAENVSEYTFLEGVYTAWKASGNDNWMKSMLDHCISAIKYVTSDDRRWSDTYKLLKRGYTIDIWDFTPGEYHKNASAKEQSTKSEITDFSIMYGDNIGMAVGCQYLAEMLEYFERNDEAAVYRKLSEELLQRINELSWNGAFYTHHVKEDPVMHHDFGNTPLDRQVTLSNAFAINRRIGLDNARAIIETYLKIRDEMPTSSPGEWFTCYPPYEKGWNIPEWESLNGGVSSIVGGELAHGAFENGYESYGVDILRRLYDIAKGSNNVMKSIYLGAMPKEPERNFDMISLKDYINADTHGKGAPGVPAFIGEGDNDLSQFPSGNQSFHGIPFFLTDPDINGGKGCLILSNDKNYLQKISIPVNQTASSVYMIHTQVNGEHIGEVILHYSDGTHYKSYISNGVNINSMWFPEETYNENLKIAQIVENKESRAVGAYLYSFNNPHPEKTINYIGFEKSEDKGKWIILGLTLCDQNQWFMPESTSYGASDNWGASEVLYAILEGLAGVKDRGVAMNKVTVSPRWEAAKINEVTATVKYEASGGYIRYKYFKENENLLRLIFTSTSDSTTVRILLPEGKDVQFIHHNGELLTYSITVNVKDSKYLTVTIDGIDVHELKLELM